MNILHVTPHLGGGVGKAHAAIRGALPGDVTQTFVLLEPPRDRRYVDLIETAGAQVFTATRLDDVARLATLADVVQFEFWNHPRMLECLARCAFPAMRSAFWSHVSGLVRPVIPPGLVETADRFVLTTEASYEAPFMALLDETARTKVTAINSGFGFGSDREARQGAGSLSPRKRGEAKAAARRQLGIAYLGTVDFVKMHPGFFDVVDCLEGDNIRAFVWGEPNDAAVQRARAMRHAERFMFGGQTTDPASALGQADIFFYPLRRDHYGTAENALVEAMSLGLVPVVLDNPAERAIVRHGETGFVARSIEQCTALLQTLLSSPDTLLRVSDNAKRHVAATRTPERSARDFATLWQSLLDEPKRYRDFRSIIGDSPADWFLATQCLPGETWTPPGRLSHEPPAKGAFAHFESAFPDEASLLRLKACVGDATPYFAGSHRLPSLRAIASRR
jgi:hypothetical protein